MCGKEDVKLVRAKVDQSVLTVCQECASFGTVLGEPSSSSSDASGGGTPSGSSEPDLPSRSKSTSRRKDPLEQTSEKQLKEDYGQIIRSAREERGWSQEDLGREMAEKVSVIKELEGRKMTPPDDLVQKLERTLDVELMEEVEPVDVQSSGSSSRGMTLGDLIKQQAEDED